MPPRAQNSRLAAKKQQQDRNSPATSVDVSVTNLAKSSTVPRNTTANGNAAANPRKRTAPNASDAAANKRKKMEGGGVNGVNGGEMTGSKGAKTSHAAGRQDSEPPEDPKHTIDFTTLSGPTVHRYLHKFNLVPPMYPSPHTHYIPSLPPHILNPPPPPQIHTRSPSPHPHAPPVNRSRNTRRSSAGATSRRSTRLADDEFHQVVYGGIKEKLGKPIMNDTMEADKAYVEIARRHWDGMVVKEAETIDAFWLSVKNKDKLLKVSVAV